MTRLTKLPFSDRLLLSAKEQISREHGYFACAMNSTNIRVGQALKNTLF